MRVVTAAGEAFALGDVEATPTIGITDCSRRVTDDFGVTTVVERGFSRRMSVKLAVPFVDVDALQRRLASLRATAALWVADDRFASLSVRGFYKDFDLDVATRPLSYCTLTVEGLAETVAPADAGGDPAPAGRPSTLQLLQPVIMTDSVLTQSSVAETDAAEWAPLATYATGARVMKATTHRIYESLVNANVGNDPADASGKWFDVGPTNRWAMFDQALGTSTIAAGSIVVTLDAGTAGAVALLDVTAATVRVRAPGYDRTLAVGAGATTFLDLPSTGQVTVTIAGTGTVSVGTLLIGRAVKLGITEASPTAGITDFSKKTVDDFGEVTIVERAWAKRMTAKALIRTDAIDAVANRIAAVRARPSLWIGQTGVDSLTVYGFFKDFSIEVGETLSKLSLSIEGLSAAAKVGPLVNWADVGDPTGTKPDNNATNGADPGSPFGDTTIGAFRQLVARTVADVDDLFVATAPIPDLTGKVDGLLSDLPVLAGAVSAIEQVAIPALQTDVAAIDSTLGAIEQTTIPALRSDIAGIGDTVGAIGSIRLPALAATIAVARVETETAQRRAEDVAADLANALLRALAQADRTRVAMRDAGIYIDPVSGVARLYATERQAEKLSQVEVALNAVTAQVTLRATVNYVNEKIALAQIAPGQVVDLTAIIARITSAELTIDGLKATLALTASAATVTALGGTVTTLSQQFDALSGTVRTKADSATVDAIATRVSAAEQTIIAYGDVSSYSVTLRQARAVADTGANALLRGLVSEDATARRHVAEQADLQFQLSSTIVAGLSAEAAQRIALAAQVAGNQASVTSSLSALATTTSAQAQQLTGLGASIAGQAAAIQQLSDVQVRADASTAAVSTTLRQVQTAASTGADAALRALVADDDAARANVTAIVQAHSEMSTTIVAGQLAQASTNFSLLAKIGTAQAAITSAQAALATLTAATTTRLDAAESAIGAANARLTTEETTRADAISAEAAARRALAAVVNDPATGLAATRAGFSEQVTALADQQGATAQTVAGLGAAVGDNAGAIEEVRGVAVTAKTATTLLSTTLRQVTDAGDGGAEAALRAVVAGDTEARTRVGSIAQVQQDFSITRVGDRAQQALANFALLAKVDSAAAAIVETRKVVADLNTATTTRLTSAESSIVTANARITAEGKTRADAISAEASERAAIGAQVNDPTTGLAATRSGFSQQITALSDRQAATASSVTSLFGAVDDNAGLIEDVRRIAVTANSATTSLSTTLRQVTGDGDGSAEAALRAVVAGDTEARTRVGSLAQVQQDFSITRVGDRAQQALTNFSLLAMVDGAAAAIVETRKVVADQGAASTARFAATESAIGAANARLTTEETTRAEADAAEALARRALEATVNDSATGLAATRAYAIEQVDLLAEADRATAERIDAIGVQVNDPASGLPRTRADLIAQGEAFADATQANAATIEAVRAEVIDPVTGLEKTRADLVEQGSVFAAANEANADEIAQVQALLLDPNTGLAAAFAKVLAERQASVARDEANASATQEVSASLGVLGGRVERTEAVQVDLAGKVAARFQQFAQVGDQVAGIRAVVELADGTITSNVALIGQAVGIWLQSGSQLVRAIGIDLVNGSPVAKFFGEVLANSITVDKLKVNSAVVPGFTSSTAPIVGTGIGPNFVSVLRTTINLAVAGVIDVDGGALQAFADYPNSPTAWQFGLYIDGHLEWAPGGQAPGDAVAVGGQRFCEAGTRVIELVWQGATTATLRDRYLKIRGFNNTTN